MIKGACYVRVSTDNQLENYSIEEQTDRLRAYCKAKDIHIVKFYTDGGYSGGNLNRPALQQMLTDIDYGIIDLVVVYKLDRLSRSQKDTLTLIEDCFLSKNVDFISINENFDTSTPFGRAMRSPSVSPWAGSVAPRVDIFTAALPPPLDMIT